MSASFAHLYSRFRHAHQGAQFYTAHSHHFWPDVTRDAMLQYWDDSAAWVDDKWAHLFAELVPQLQQHISTRLNLSQPQQLVFAPNTHELLYRILSCFSAEKPLRVLTTDGEFHSFRRQIDRFSEQPNVQVRRVSLEPFASLTERMLLELEVGRFEVLFISQVFFGCGRVVKNLNELVSSAYRQGCQVVIDGYHGFCAIPTNLRDLEGRCFYLGGGYKYAQAGEGSCFMHVPAGCKLRPLNTGWYAEFAALPNQAGRHQVNYPDNGMRFAGATLDMSPFYRQRAVLELFAQLGLDDEMLHRLVVERRDAFLYQLDDLGVEIIGRHNLLGGKEPHGHFLAFQLSSPEQVQSLLCYLRRHKIYADGRGSRIRFGFGLHMDQHEMDLSPLLRFG